MRTVVTDDDGSEWSIEILDGDHVNAPTKSVKQTPPTRSGTASEPALKECGTPVLRERLFNKGRGPSNPAGWPGKHETRSRYTPENFAGASMEADRLRGSPHFERNASDESPFDGPALVEWFTLEEKGAELNVELSLPSEPLKPLNNVLTDSHDHEQARSQKKRQFAESHQLIQLAKDTPSNSPTRNQSACKVSEAETSLPAYSFMEYRCAPAVVYTKSESEANALVQALKGPLGFDMEWRVMWHLGAQERRTALVQMCDRHTILLIQVSSMKRFPRSVLKVIESADIVKTGANILNDGEKLFRDFGIRAKGLVELGAFATRADDKFSSVYNREIVSLAKMVAMYLGKTLRKGKVRTSNWEADLSHEMVEYAANDCHCALMVYDRLQEIAAQAGKSLDVSTYACQVDPRALKSDAANSLPPPALPSYCIPEPARPQQLRAYKLWHVDKMPLEEMCMMLRTGERVEPLKESTVISYVVGALQADSRLPFDMNDLRALVLMEAGSWQRHRGWIASRE